MRLTGRILVGVFGCVIVAQFLGYKIFGSSTVVENRPLLPRPQIVVRLESPNIAVTAEGHRIPVKGIVFHPEATQLVGAALPRLFNELDPIRILPDASQPSGVASERRLIYSCGNTFHPRFFPGRIPKYQISDFGDFIRANHLDIGPSEPAP